jgi:hypothetical protein
MNKQLKNSINNLAGAYGNAINSINIKGKVLEVVMDSLLDIFRFFFEVFRDYLSEFKKHFLKIPLFLLLFLLLKFVPRFENIVFENIAPNTVFTFWIMLIYFCLFLRFSAFLPISTDTYKKAKGKFIKIRNSIFPAGLILSCWLTFQGFFSIFSGQFLYKKFFAALFLQVLFIPLFFGLSEPKDVNDFRRFRKNKMSKRRRMFYWSWVILIFFLFVVLPIFLIGDIYTLPNFKINN